MGRRLELAIAALNGTIGDYLARTGNGLATAMTLVEHGAPSPTATRVVVLAHGLMGNEDVWTMADGSDYGSRLAHDLDVAPLYLRYNSGLAIPDNGVALADLLEATLDARPRPVDEIILLGHSMGGLVARSACHVAAQRGDRWLARVHRAIYVGTPHRGAPLERWGRRLSRLLASIPDPYARLAAQIGDLRSDGIKDLGDADLRHEDRARRRVASPHETALALRDPAHPVPLLPSIRHLLIAGTIARDPALATWFGDALVPVPSATDGHATARAPIERLPDHVKLLPGIGHMSLAAHPEVYAHVRAWCEVAS